MNALGVVLLGERGRRLALPAPLAGKVVAVNPDPDGDAGRWMLRIRPQEALSACALMHGSAARRWVAEAQALVLSRLDPAVGRIAQDGGVFQRAWGELLADHIWTEIKGELFPDAEGRRTS